MDRFKCPLAVFLLLEKQNKLCLQLRQNCSFSGCWGTIGGHLDGGETVVDALIREAQEEAGIDILPTDLKLATICHSNAGGREYIQFFYTCHNWSGEVTIQEPDKCAQIEWFDMEQLPENMPPYLKSALNKIKENQIFFEDGF